MRRFGWKWLAISSVLIGALAAGAETRPEYGGTLHLMMRANPSSLDPSDLFQVSSFAGRNIIALIFDTLVTTDGSGRLEPALAESWQSSGGNQRVQLRLRRGVKFHDGTPLTGDIAAASLRKANASWNVVADGDVIVIECEAADPDLMQELASPRNAIARKSSENATSGTGPFHIVNWQPSNQLSLVAEEDYWRGRAFLDAVEIEMGKSFRDQMNALESGRADLIEVAPEQMHRVSPERYLLIRSAPMELVALKFARDAASADEKTMREVLRLSVERRSMHSVLLQGAGQLTASLLPTHISGYGFVFSSEADLPRARQLREQMHGAPALTMGYDAGDPLERLLAERIALNAKDAGLSLQLNPSAADLRLVRIPLSSVDPWILMDELDKQLGLPVANDKSHTTANLYASEQAALATDRAIPLFHLPVCYASASNLRGWMVRTDGILDLGDAWIKSARR